jgi:hypothetical protein
MINQTERFGAFKGVPMIGTMMDGRGIESVFILKKISNIERQYKADSCRKFCI